MQDIRKESELRRMNRIRLEVIAKEFVQCIKRDVRGRLAASTVVALGAERPRRDAHL